MLDLVRTHLPEFSGLEHPQQEGLGLQGEFGDLIQEERSAVGILEIPLAGLGGTGEGSLDMAEQFGVHQFLGEGSAVDHEERGVPPGRILVDNPREILLAHAAFSLNQHAEARRSELHGRFQRLVQGRIISDNIVFVF